MKSITKNTLTALLIGSFWVGTLALTQAQNSEEEEKTPKKAKIENSNMNINTQLKFQLVPKPPIKSKLELKPLEEVEVSLQEDFDYSSTVSFSRLTFNDLPNEIAPIISPTLHQNYVKAGFGNYLSPYFESFYSTPSEKEANQFGVFAHHFSSMRGIVDKENSAYGTTRLMAFSEHRREKFVLFSNLNYNLERIHYYGYDQELDQPNKSDIQQNYHRLEGKLGIRSFTKTKKGREPSQKLNYSASLGFNYFRARDNISEFQIPVLGSISYNLREKSKLQVSSEFHYTSQRSSTELEELSNQRALASISPVWNFSTENLTLNLGAGVAYSSDSLLESSTENALLFYPNIEISYTVLKDKLWLLGKMKGGVEQNFLRTLTMQNPFLASVQPLSHTFAQIDAGITAQGKLNKFLYLNTEIAFTSYDNMPFFAPSADDISQFSVLYDEVNVMRMSLGGRFQKDDLSIRLKGSYFNYSLTNLEVAHHRPTLQTDLQITHTFFEKLRAEVGLQQLFGLETQNPISQTNYKLKPIHNLNAALSYQFTERISVFLNGYNLIGQNYERFIFYPTNGIMGVVGGKYTF